MNGALAGSKATTHPFTLTVAPAASVAGQGVRHVRDQVIVANNGTRPLAVTTSAQLAEQQHGRCNVIGKVPWAHASPGAFRLRPGHREVVQFTIRAPGSVHGKTGIVMLAEGRIPGHHSGAAVLGGAVGSQVQLRLPGKPAVQPCYLAVPKSPGSGFPVAYAGLAAVLLALAVLVVMVVRRRRKAA